jgi:hypothetical protein
MIEAVKNRRDVVEVLLLAGADANARNKRSQRPIELTRDGIVAKMLENGVTVESSQRNQLENDDEEESEKEECGGDDEDEDDDDDEDEGGDGDDEA